MARAFVWIDAHCTVYIARGHWTHTMMVLFLFLFRYNVPLCISIENTIFLRLLCAHKSCALAISIDKLLDSCQGSGQYLSSNQHVLPLKRAPFQLLYNGYIENLDIYLFVSFHDLLFVSWDSFGQDPIHSVPLFCILFSSLNCSFCVLSL